LFSVIPTSGCPEFVDIGKGVVIQVLLVGDKQVLRIECQPGHDLIGPPKILCVDGQWEHIQKPQCSKRKSIAIDRILSKIKRNIEKDIRS
jgi:hypothetical protein